MCIPCDLAGPSQYDLWHATSGWCHLPSDDIVRSEVYVNVEIMLNILSTQSFPTKLASSTQLCIPVLEQFDMIFSRVHRIMKLDFDQAGGPSWLQWCSCANFKCEVSDVNRFLPWWFHGPKTRFCGLWSPITVKTFHIIFSSTDLSIICVKYGFLCAVYFEKKKSNNLR